MPTNFNIQYYETIPGPLDAKNAVGTGQEWLDIDTLLSNPTGGSALYVGLRIADVTNNRYYKIASKTGVGPYTYGVDFDDNHKMYMEEVVNGAVPTTACFAGDILFDKNTGNIWKKSSDGANGVASAWIAGDKAFDFEVAATDTNYYPTTFAWTGGTNAGPTGSLTGEGMTAVPFAAIPKATGSTSGIVTSDANTQTFGGPKTFAALITGSLGLTVTGAATTITGGHFKVNEDSTANAASIGTSANTGAITLGGTGTGQAIYIGNAAAAKDIQIGNNTTTTSTVIKSGTGNIVLNSTGTIGLTSTGASTITSTTFTVDASSDITLDSDSGIIYLKNGGTKFGSIEDSNTHIVIKDGTTVNLTLSGADATLAGNLTVGAGTTGAIISTGTTFALIDTVSTTVNFAGASQALNIGNDGTIMSTTNIATGLGSTAGGQYKTINIGTGGQSANVTNINIGSATSGALGTTTINSVETVVKKISASGFARAGVEYQTAAGSGTQILTVDFSKGNSVFYVNTGSASSTLIIRMATGNDSQSELTSYSGGSFLISIVNNSTGTLTVQIDNDPEVFSGFAASGTASVGSLTTLTGLTYSGMIYPTDAGNNLATCYGIVSPLTANLIG